MMRCPICHSGTFIPRTDAGEIREENRARERFVRRSLGRKPRPEESLDLTEFMHGGNGQLATCAGCGLTVRDEAATAHYESDVLDPDVLKSVYPQYLAAFLRKRKPYRSRLPSHADVIEVGSHLGAFLETAEQTGWRALGFDVGEYSSAFARHKGLAVRREDLHDARVSANSADAVFLWNCFDQLDSPEQVLEDSRRVLKEGGSLVVRTPNVGFYYRQRERWRRGDAEAFRDLALNNLLGFPYRIGYDPITLSAILRRHGFAPQFGVDSTVVTVPFIEPTPSTLEQMAAAHAPYADGEPRDPLRLQGPWIEILCRKLD